MEKFNIFYIIGNILFGFVILIFFMSKYHLKIIRYFKNFFCLTDKKNKSSEINTNDRVEILKDRYSIKSTEKTNVNLKYLIDSPQQLNFNQSDGIKINYFNNNKLKKLSIDTLSDKIIQNFIYNKKLFMKLFVGEDERYIISNLENFYEFQKKNIITKNPKKYNILLKFFSKNKYLYIFVNNTELIKITNFEQYDKISQLLENNNNIFLIRNKIENKEKYFITYGGYSSCNINSNLLKKTFFINKNTDNKNYKLLSGFDTINIYFFVCTEMSN